MSIDQWQGNIQQESEFQLVIKTNLAKFSELSSRIQEIHSYELVGVWFANLLFYWVKAIYFKKGDRNSINWPQFAPSIGIKREYLLNFNIDQYIAVF